MHSNEIEDRCRQFFQDTSKLEMDGPALAQMFHETYERLAPDFGYKTREASAVPWADVPAANKNLMVAVATSILERLNGG